MSRYTEEQMKIRQESKWTLVQAVLAPLQLLAFIVSAVLIVHYLNTGEGYAIANISVLIKIALLWVITITGMFWEKEVFGHWFLAPEFYWEDAFNGIAMLAHNLYFVVILLGWDESSVMMLMLIAYSTYILNFSQFAWRGWRSHRQRVGMRQQEAVA